MQLKQIGEFKLIDIISRQVSPTASVIKGIGDDAAVIKIGKSRCLVVTTDILTENIHFRTEFTTPYLLGKKTMAVNLSDIAAMGATPLYYLVCLTIPSHTSTSFVRNLYKGMNYTAKQYGTCLVGGDTSSSTTKISISVTLIGTAKSKNIIYRNNAKKGDLIFITGSPGDSSLGLMMLEKSNGRIKKNNLVKKHLDPVPRVKAGLEIARQKIASSMIDISDGLAADLKHILEQSQSGAVINLSQLPLSPSYRKNVSAYTNQFYYPALCGGEDYELLFTVSPEKKQSAEKLAEKTGIPITCIGEITSCSAGLVILDENGKKFTLKRSGYTHF